MGLKFNPFTGTFDFVENKNKYVKKSGDTMTGNLNLPALIATNPGYSVFNGGIILKQGQKLILDGSG